MAAGSSAGRRWRDGIAAVLVVLVAVAWIAMTAESAGAACHVAAFVESEVEVSESAGSVSVVVELQGRVASCEGTVDVATVDGEAVAGEDYEAVTRTLTFEEGDDREETVEVTILADDQDDDGETFTVELSNPTGGLSGTGDPATVTITDDAGVATPDDDPTGGPTPAEDATDIAGEVVDEEDEGLDVGILLAVVAALLVGGAAVVLLRGRGR